LLDTMSTLCSDADPAYAKQSKSSFLPTYTSNHGVFTVHMWSDSLEVLERIDARDAAVACKMLADAMTNLEREQDNELYEIHMHTELIQFVNVSETKLLDLVVHALVSAMCESSPLIQRNVSLTTWRNTVRMFIRDMSATGADNAADAFVFLKIFRHDMQMLLTEHGPAWSIYLKHACYAHDSSVRHQKYSVSTYHATVNDLLELDFMQGHSCSMALFFVSRDGVCEQIHLTDANAKLSSYNISDETIIWLITEDRLLAKFDDINANAEGPRLIWQHIAFRI